MQPPAVGLTLLMLNACPWALEIALEIAICSCLLIGFSRNENFCDQADDC